MIVKKFFDNGEYLRDGYEEPATYEEFVNAVTLNSHTTLVIANSGIFGTLAILKLSASICSYTAVDTLGKVIFNEVSSVSYDYELLSRFFTQRESILQIEMDQIITKLEETARNFSGIQAAGYKFDYREMVMVNFSNANCRKALFLWSNVSESRFIATMLEGASFNSSNISYTDFRKAIASESAWVNVYGYKAKFTSAELKGVVFENCDLCMVDFSLAWLQNATFKNCNLLGARFYNTILTNTKFIDCNLDLTTVTDCPNMDPRNFINCSRRGAFTSWQV